MYKFDGMITQVEQEGELYMVELTEEGKKHFTTPGCSCRIIISPLPGSIFVGSIDDCPVHGFGKNTLVA